MYMKLVDVPDFIKPGNMDAFPRDDDDVALIQFIQCPDLSRTATGKTKLFQQFKILQKIDDLDFSPDFWSRLFRHTTFASPV